MTEELKFEKALERLEKIVEELESGNIPLEEALKKYEEGVRLSRACSEKLTQAEKKIEVLTKTLGGALKREPFELDEKEKE
ncbi:MAG: exodeoxyribonuclease VII small subunit [Candidatus Omnitrophica bacterium]|nr:exodeoxyribonuclease VII small subunit [Candidatus Omnitrophota bacterium]